MSWRIKRFMGYLVAFSYSGSVSNTQPVVRIPLYTVSLPFVAVDIGERNRLQYGVQISDGIVSHNNPNGYVAEDNLFGLFFYSLTSKEYCLFKAINPRTQLRHLQHGCWARRCRRDKRVSRRQAHPQWKQPSNLSCHCNQACSDNSCLDR